jgi:glucan phosphoethanolaminetransferase (alkaline phosphatase superfamily)
MKLLSHVKKKPMLIRCKPTLRCSLNVLSYVDNTRTKMHVVLFFVLFVCLFFGLFGCFAFFWFIILLCLFIIISARNMHDYIPVDLDWWCRDRHILFVFGTFTFF